MSLNFYLDLRDQFSHLMSCLKKLETQVKELHDMVDALGGEVLSKFDGTERQLTRDLQVKVNSVP